MSAWAVKDATETWQDVCDRAWAGEPQFVTRGPSQIAGVLVSIAAIVFAWRSAKRQGEEVAKENKISLMNRRMEYLALLNVLSKCLSIVGNSAMRASGDGVFSPLAFALQMEDFLKKNPILRRLMLENLVNLDKIENPFFKESTCCLIEKLNEGAFLFRSSEIASAIQALQLVFKLAGGWSPDDGVILDPPDECKLYSSMTAALDKIETAIAAGNEEMKL